MSSVTMTSAHKQEQPSVSHVPPTYTSLSSYLNRPLPALPTHTPSHKLRDCSASRCPPTRVDRVMPSTALTFSTDDENFDVVAFHRSAALMLAGQHLKPPKGHATSVFGLQQHEETCVTDGSNLDVLIEKHSLESEGLASVDHSCVDNDTTLPESNVVAVSQQFWIYDGDHTWHKTPSATTPASYASNNSLLGRVEDVVSSVTNPGAQLSSVECELCGDRFDDYVGEDFATHIGQHSLDFAEKRHECDDCQISFASARDLQRHLQSVLLTQHCGLDFAHAETDENGESCCNGHHPPTYFKTCLTSDHDLMAHHLWAWESSQLQSHRRIVADVLTAKLSHHGLATLPVITTFPHSPTIVSTSSTLNDSMPPSMPSRLSLLSSHTESPSSATIPALQFYSRSKRAPIIPQNPRRRSATFSFVPSPRTSLSSSLGLTDDSSHSSIEQDSTRSDSILVDDFLYQQTLLNIYADSLAYKNGIIEPLSVSSVKYCADEEHARPDSGVLPKHSLSPKPIIITLLSSAKRSAFLSPLSKSSLSPASTFKDATRELMPQQSSLRNLARFYHRNSRNKHGLAGADYGSSAASSSSSLVDNQDDFQHTSHSMSRLHARA